jgi:exonuclease SbcC
LHITKISIKGFESHEDTVIDELSPGLNAFVGASNSGKSSIVRALALLAYQQFDPKSLRNGCDNCEVEVTTTNGRVKVTRGKKNLWEVTDRTGKTSYFDKIGKQILPQVTEVLGFGLVKLGDIEMKANIMDQLEAHFMLAEFDGQDATGSLRAQVVDEISGLSGIEGLIREVGLDNNRLTRETNQTEERLKEIGLQLHDEQELQREECLLRRVEESLTRHDENLEVVGVLAAVGREYQEAKAETTSLQNEWANLPDEVKTQKFLMAVEKALQDIGVMRQEYEVWSAGRKEVRRLEVELGELPDEIEVLKRTQKVQDRIQQAGQVRELSDALTREREASAKLKVELSKLGDSESANSNLLATEKLLERRRQADEFLDQYFRQQDEVERLKKALLMVEKEEQAAEKESAAAMSSIDICPLTLKPISGECLKGIKA